MSRMAGTAAALIVFVTIAAAQEPLIKVPPTQPRPAADIFLASFEEGEDRNVRVAILVFSKRGIRVGKPVNLTNSAANDERPAFLPDSSGVVFSSKRDGEESVTFRYDIVKKSTVRAEAIAPGADEAPSVVKTPTGSAIMGRESKLFLKKHEADEWMEIADLAKAGVTDITRVAVSPDGKWIALAAVHRGVPILLK